MANRVQCNRCAASLRRTVLIFFDCFSNGHISGALAELIRSTRAPTKDRLKGKIMSGNPVFRGTRVPVHMLAELVPPRACARALPEGKCDTILATSKSRRSPLDPRIWLHQPGADRPRGRHYRRPRPGAR